MCVPVPAVTGLKVFPTTPFPDQIPPTGVALYKVNIAVASQTKVSKPAFTTGVAPTVIKVVSERLQVKEPAFMV